MFQDSRNVTRNTVIQTDLCIIGGGAAGIAIAREFLNTATDIVLLESGGLELDEETQSLYRGKTVGLDHSLVASRFRYFGGSTNKWKGNCRPLDEIDFHKRSWIPYSGWPFQKQDLIPFYKRAQEFCQLGEYDYDSNFQKDVIGTPPLDLKNKPIKNILVKTSKAMHYGEEYHDSISKAQNIHAYLYANVVEIVTNESGNAAVQVKVACLTGNEFYVSAKIFVLASGAVENARLMLNSDSVHKKGLGNENDLVGRFFMGHPIVHFPFPGGDDPVLSFYNQGERQRINGVGVWGMMCITDDMVRQRNLPGTCVYLQPEVPIAVKSLKALYGSAKHRNMPDKPLSHLMNVTLGVVDIGEFLYKKHVLKKLTSKNFEIKTMFEQTPDPENRITLTPELDPLKMRRVQLNLRLSSDEKEGYTNALMILGKELGVTDLDFAKKRIENERVRFYSHHIGTTRMNEDPHQGVVDTNCRVHGISNLFISGSSVFPTSGSAAPTLTIVALAIRLADHLKEAIR
jgi:choline dehydrogenase-like flavoprotein